MRASPGPWKASGPSGGVTGWSSSRMPIRLLSSRRRAIDPAAVLVSDTQFSTSSCSNMPVDPKHIRYAL